MSTYAIRLSLTAALLLTAMTSCDNDDNPSSETPASEKSQSPNENASGSAPTPTPSAAPEQPPEDIDPVELAQRVGAAMDSVKTMKVESTKTITSDSSFGTFVDQMEIDDSGPELRQKVTSKCIDGEACDGIPESVLITIGLRIYNSVGGEWASTDADSSTGVASQLKSYRAYIEDMGSITPLPSSSLSDGTALANYSLILSAPEKHGFLTDYTMSIGVDKDYLIREVNFTSQGEVGDTVQHDLAEYGVPVGPIEAPADATPVG